MQSILQASDLTGKTIKDYYYTNKESGTYCVMKFTDGTSITWLGTFPIEVPFIIGRKYYKEFKGTFRYKGICYWEGNPYFLMYDIENNNDRLFHVAESKGFIEVE